MSQMPCGLDLEEATRLTWQVPVRRFSFLFFCSFSLLFSSPFSAFCSSRKVMASEETQNHDRVWDDPTVSGKGKESSEEQRETALSARRLGGTRPSQVERGRGKPVRLVDHPCPRAPRALRSRGEGEGETRAVRPTSDAHGKRERARQR